MLIQKLQPDGLERKRSYCPGCGHGIIHRLIVEATNKLMVSGRVVFFVPVGCSSLAPAYLPAYDIIESPHGRNPATVTGFKRLNPDAVVINYQGDGDAISIGLNEMLHTAYRNENITTVVVNNGIYGMTGGQLAPTTPLGLRTSTTRYGRVKEHHGSPIDLCRHLALVDVPYIERTSVHDYNNIQNTKRAVEKAIQCQLGGKGFSLVEILSQCPVGWKMRPVEACRYITEHMSKVFPLGIYKDET